MTRADDTNDPPRSVAQVMADIAAARGAGTRERRRRTRGAVAQVMADRAAEREGRTGQ